jgi:hypothetical protein
VNRDASTGGPEGNQPPPAVSSHCPCCTDRGPRRPPGSAGHRVGGGRSGGRPGGARHLRGSLSASTLPPPEPTPHPRGVPSPPHSAASIGGQLAGSGELWCDCGPPWASGPASSPGGKLTLQNWFVLDFRQLEICIP